MSLHTYIHYIVVYIYREREKERDIDINVDIVILIDITIVFEHPIVENDLRYYSSYKSYVYTLEIKNKSQ